MKEITIQKGFAESLGYTGARDLVAAYYESESDDWVLNDGDSMSIVQNWKSIVAFIETNKEKLYPYVFGGGGSPAKHWLVCNRVYGSVAAGTARESETAISLRKCAVCYNTIDISSPTFYNLPRVEGGSQLIACKEAHRDQWYRDNDMSEGLEELKELEDLEDLDVG